MIRSSVLIQYLAVVALAFFYDGRCFLAEGFVVVPSSTRRTYSSSGVITTATTTTGIPPRRGGEGITTISPSIGRTTTGTRRNNGNNGRIPYESRSIVKLFLSASTTPTTTTGNNGSSVADNTNNNQIKNPTKASSTRITGRKRLSGCMAFLAGLSNIAIFTKFKTFATMLTGNTMWLALSMTEGKLVDATYYLSVIMSYLLGTAIFRRTDLSHRKQTLPICAAMVATLFVTGDCLIHCFGTTTATATATARVRWIPMILFANAFGIINSLGMEVSGTLTFVVTGHLTRLVNMVVDRLSRTAGRNQFTQEQKTAMILNSSIYCGFFAGAVFASILMGIGLLDRFGIFSTIGLIHAVLWLAHHDMEALGGAWWVRKDNKLCDIDDTGEECDLEEVKGDPTTDNNSSIGKDSHCKGVRERPEESRRDSFAEPEAGTG